MIHYNYNQQIVPPAPFVHATLRCVERGTELKDRPAQVDTGADRTAIPESFVKELQLLPLDEIQIGGFGGQVLVVPTYRVQVSIRNLEEITIEVIAHPEESFVLLGRDVLNRYRLLLDGPRLFLEIG